MAELDFLHQVTTTATTARLKLFGFDFDSNTRQQDQETAESPFLDHHSSGKSSTGSPEPPFSTARAGSSDGRKYECQYCYREFANSQALGGHQNAHKKERQQIKRAQIHASRAAFNPIISAFTPPHHLLTSAPPSSSWVYMPRAVQAPLHVAHGCAFPTTSGGVMMSRGGVGAGGISHASGVPESTGATASFHYSPDYRHLQQEHAEARGMEMSRDGPTSLSRFSNGPNFDDSVGLDLHLSLAPAGS